MLYPLSRAADHSKIWIALAVMLASRGGRANRRAALRGVLSVAATSVLTNAVMKPMTSRVRPTPVPDGWMTRVARVPSSTSFPSGHAASAGAFAVGASLEMPSSPDRSGWRRPPWAGRVCEHGCTTRAMS